MKRIRNSPYTIWSLSSLFLFIDTFVYSLALAALPSILQQHLHVTESFNGIVTTMFGIGGILGSLFTGFLSDKWSKRRIFQILVALLYISAGLVLYFTTHFYQLLVFRLINGMASGTACTMLYSAVGDVFPANLLGFKVAVMYFFNSLSYTIGPICGQRLFGLTGSIHSISLFIISLGCLEFALLVTISGDSLEIREESRRRSDITPPFVLTMEATNNVPIWRLVFLVPVILSTVSIISSIGMQCILELLVPLHLDRHFNLSDRIGITFVAYGISLTILTPIIGRFTDFFIDRYGNHTRYYLMCIGSVTTILFMVWIGLSGTYQLLLAGYILYAISNLLMFIPAQSAYGDLNNILGNNSMAQSYAIATISWDIGALVPPPISTALYSSAGFAKPIIGTAAVGCSICAIAFLIYGIKLQRKAVRSIEYKGPIAKEQDSKNGS